ncbi:hypothetical protein LX36DRAFT_130360 [Colletotrichum falcatum]|nr:hypothetical protein LX36DRAFT_130360 [Colletotrichum falcatum]
MLRDLDEISKRKIHIVHDNVRNKLFVMNSTRWTRRPTPGSQSPDRLAVEGEKNAMRRTGKRQHGSVSPDRERRSISPLFPLVTPETRGVSAQVGHTEKHLASRGFRASHRPRRDTHRLLSGSSFTYDTYALYIHGTRYGFGRKASAGGGGDGGENGRDGEDAKAVRFDIIHGNGIRGVANHLGPRCPSVTEHGRRRAGRWPCVRSPASLNRRKGWPSSR